MRLAGGLGVAGGRAGGRADWGPGAVGFLDELVAVFVQVVVMVVADEHEVAEIGRPAVGPVNDVVRIAS